MKKTREEETSMVSKPASNKTYLKLAGVFLLGFSLSLFFRGYVANIYNVRGNSMESNYHHGELLIGYKLNKTYDRGDVVVVDTESHGRIVKRIVGLPGENIKLEGNKVYINNEELSEDYVNEDNNTYKHKEIEFNLNENMYMVFGDNRDNSTDSRIFGPITKDMIEAVIINRRK